VRAGSRGANKIHYLLIGKPDAAYEVIVSRQKIGSIDDVGQRRPLPISLTKLAIVGACIPRPIISITDQGGEYTPLRGLALLLLFSRTISPYHYSDDDNLIRVIYSAPRIQNLDRFIYVLQMADGRMNYSKSDHDFNPEIRGGHVRIDARASLRAQHRE
jgi:hypothetical protein